jgi:glycosyltransferase involved in cell wall biosynthesis
MRTIASARVEAPAPQPPTGRRAPEVEIVVPVFNEQDVLETSIRRLHDHVTWSLPFSWRIVIADNASTDATAAIADRLARELAHVSVLHVPTRGRGGALRTAWTRSTATVVAYMDVDLSTDLAALLPLLAPLVSGHSELAIGSRLAHGARVRRGLRRELISRAYNHLLRLALRARFSDAQCGFKAARRDALRALLPTVRDDGWFFDTELLIAAQRAGRRIHEVPVDWTEDPNSSVALLSTAAGDIRGVVRLALATRVGRFMAIGALSTLAYALLYLALRAPLGPPAANALALALTGLANTQANRRWTFGVRGNAGLARQHLLGAIVYAVALALTAGALEVLHRLDARPARALELAVLVSASAAATVMRYVALKTVVFARGAIFGRCPPDTEASASAA